MVSIFAWRTSGPYVMADMCRLVDIHRATRTLGTLIGLVLNLSWAWYFWPEGHGYFMSSLSIFLWTSSVACDLYYPILLWKVQLSEVTLSEGRKISREAARFESSEETH